MKYQCSIDDFISRLALKISTLYPNNCADKEDYIQAGHLKLAEIKCGNNDHRNFMAYDIVAISRAMRETALGAMCAASAPCGVKKLVHKIELLFSHGRTEKEIQIELNIDSQTLSTLRTLSASYSWYELFDEPSHEQEPFSAINDLLSSCCLDEKDKEFIRSQIDENSIDTMTRKQRWIHTKRIRNKLVRSGYGT